MMLYHNTMNSDYKRVARKILAEQAKSDHKDITISKVQQIAQEIGLKIKNVENKHKQIQMEKTDERKNKNINWRKNKAENGK